MDLDRCKVPVLVLLLTIILVFYYEHNKNRYHDMRNMIKSKTTPCSFNALRTYYEQFNQLPSNGSWMKKDNIEYYEPDFCTVRHPRVDVKFLEQCFDKSDMTYIVSMGDSIAALYYEKLLSHFSEVSDCRFVKREENGYDPDPGYFSRGNQTIGSMMDTHSRYCGSCGGRLNECELRSSKKIIVEHIAMPLLMDTALRVRDPEKLNTEHAQDYWANTTQETISKYYFANRAPDALIVYLPFCHVKRIGPLEKGLLDIQYFRDMTKLYLTKTTRVFYIPQYSEHESKKPDSYKNMLFEGMLGTEKIKKLNELFFDVYEEDLMNATLRTYGFVDTVPMSEGRDDLSKDGVHMKDDWYEIMVALLVEMFCNSVINGEFD